MSTRERWIVYPLLFLTLGIAVRNHFLPTERLAVGKVGEFQAEEIIAQRIRCGEYIAGRAYCKQLESGGVVVVGPSGRPVLVAFADPRSQDGVLETFAADGRRLVQLQSSDVGGIVVTFGKSGRVLIIGDTGQRRPKRETPEPLRIEQPSDKEQPEQPPDVQNE